MATESFQSLRWIWITIVVLQLVDPSLVSAEQGISASCVAGRAPAGPFSATAGIAVLPGQDIIVRIGTSNHDVTFPGIYTATFTATMDTNMFFGAERTIHTKARQGGAGLGTGGIDEVPLATAGRPDGLQNVVINVTSDVTGSRVLASCDFPLLIVAPASAADTDGDGLLDVWETGGFDSDGNGTIDVDLPGFGANALHKDLFLELDWLPGQAPTLAAVQGLKGAFARAPVNAGGSDNPDGLPGINLWVDTGGLQEEGRLVGDDLGGGSEIPDVDISGLDANFYAARAEHFAAARRAIFRYGISADPSDSDVGGLGEVGGNDFVEFNHDAGTLMHEFGHNLGLQHGGINDSDNCKPNYVSVMNYDHQFGIRVSRAFRGGNRRFIDYSPAMALGRRGSAPLPDLVESNLDETARMDPLDFDVQFVFVNGLGEKVRQPLSQAPNWDGIGAADNTSVSVNVDTSGGNPPAPRACTNSVVRDATQPLRGADDWTNIQLKFRGFGDSNAAAINPETPDNPTLEELIALEERLNTADVGIVLSGSPNPVIAGTELTYTISASNSGPNPASDLWVTLALPSRVTYVTDTGGCVVTAGGTLACSLAGELSARYIWRFTVTVAVAANIGVPNSGPLTLRTHAHAENRAGLDPNLSNNDSELVSTVKARVAIDIKQGHGTNVIVLGSKAPTKVAILSSSAFDALTVDPRTVTLAGAPAIRASTGIPVTETLDVNGDGRLDLLVYIQTAALQLMPGDTEAILDGATYGGALITATTSLWIRPRMTQ